MRRNFIFLFFLLLSQAFLNQSAGQSSIKEIDQKLSDTYRALLEADMDIRNDSIAPAFKKQLKSYLSNPVTLDKELDTLATLITIVQSSDKKVKFYSWDTRTGGTWHEIDAFAQFKTGTNKVSYRQIDTDEEAMNGGFTDSEIFEVNEIKENGKVYYVTFGWGTHGSGNQHMIVQVFSIVGEKLVKCVAFNKNQKDLAIEYPRSERLDLTFDEKTRSISFNEFAETEASFASKTGKRKKLVFKSGIFK